MSLGQLVVELAANTARLQSDMGRAVHIAEQASAKISRVMKTAFTAIGATAGGFGIAELGGAIVKAATEAEQASNRVNAVLKATGFAAGVTRAEIEALADEMHGLTQFDDESVRGAAAELLKFGNINREVFGDALKSIADYAAFTGQKLPEAAQVIGKALASPSEGLMMLERQIGKLSPAQKKLIDDLVDSGRHMEAQAKVLDLLREKFGGTAAEMNTGFTRAITGVSKAWSELLEAFGRTSAVGGTTSMVLGGIEKTLTNIKNVVENGTWLDKLAVLTPQGLAGFAMRTTTAKPVEPATAEQRAAADAGRRRAEDVQHELGMNEQNEKIRKFIAERNEKAAKENAERTKKLQAEDLRGWIAHADQVFQEADDQNRAMEKIWDEYWDHQEKMKKLDLQGWVAYAEAVINEDYERTKEMAENQIKINEEAKKGSDISRQLGLTFTSAFEDAVSGGKKFSEVLKGIGMDLQKLMIRKTITEPLMEAASEFFNFKNMFGGSGGGGGGGGISGLFNSFFGGGGGGGIDAGFAGSMAFDVAGFAEGTNYVPRDGLAYLHKGEAVVPASENGRGGMTVYIDAKGADREGLARVERQLATLNASVEPRAVSAVADARRRGR